MAVASIQSLLFDSFYANGGCSLDLSGGVADRAIAHIENCYFIANVDVRSRICKTNTVSNTAYRVGLVVFLLTGGH